MEQVLLEKQELDTIKEIQQEELNLVDQLGRIEYQIQSLELEKEKLVEQLEKIKQEEKTLADNLSAKYGNGTINIDEGTLLKQ